MAGHRRAGSQLPGKLELRWGLGRAERCWRNSKNPLREVGSHLGSLDLILRSCGERRGQHVPTTRHSWGSVVCLVSGETQSFTYDLTLYY